MRLFLISPKECMHMSGLIPGISSVYQLEQEFQPYLSVEFLPNHQFPTGVLLIVGNKVIRRDYTFEDPNDIIELRKLIWQYVIELHDPTYYTNTVNNGWKNLKNNPNGPVDKHHYQIEGPTNRVIQGWQAKKRSMKKDGCCKKIKNIFAKIYADTYPQYFDHKYQSQQIKHDVYKLDPTDKQDRRICKQVRFGECTDNYPPNTPQFDICQKEVKWLCNNGYPNNIRTQTILKFRENLKNKVLKELHENNMVVNKPQFDTIMDAGFFERVNNRMGNKATTYKNVDHAIQNMNTDFYKMVEGYQDGNKNNDTKLIFDWNTGVLLLVIAIIIYLFIYKAIKEKILEWCRRLIFK